MRSPFCFLKALVFLQVFACSFAYAAAIKIAVVSGLDFGIGGPGDVAKTIAPGTAESAANASFNVTGDANRAYTITLPATANMTTGAGGATRTITVNTFTSFPAAGANGRLSAAGAQTLFVGARRAALLINQVAGTYTGSYVVTVVY